MSRLIKEWKGKYANIDLELQLYFIDEARRTLGTAHSAISHAWHLLWLLGKEQADRELEDAAFYIRAADEKLKQIRKEIAQEVEKEERSAL